MRFLSSQSFFLFTTNKGKKVLRISSVQKLHFKLNYFQTAAPNLLKFWILKIAFYLKNLSTDHFQLIWVFICFWGFLLKVFWILNLQEWDCLSSSKILYSVIRIILLIRNMTNIIRIHKLSNLFLCGILIERNRKNYCNFLKDLRQERPNV